MTLCFPALTSSIRERERERRRRNLRWWWSSSWREEKRREGNGPIITSSSSSSSSSVLGPLPSTLFYKIMEAAAAAVAGAENKEEEEGRRRRGGKRAATIPRTLLFIPCPFLFLTFQERDFSSFLCCCVCVWAPFVLLLLCIHKSLPSSLSPLILFCSILFYPSSFLDLFRPSSTRLLVVPFIVYSLATSGHIS